MGDRTGVNQPPRSGSVYPLIADNDIVPLLADFYLAYDDVTCQYKLPFRLTWLFGCGTQVPDSTPYTPTHARDLVILDADDNVVFDSTTAAHYHEAVWGSDRAICEWFTDEAPDIVARVVIFTDNADDYQTHLTPDAVLDSRTLTRMPRRVRSIKIGDQTYQGKIRFQAGYNVTLVAAAQPRIDGGRLTNLLTLNGTPGAGIGRVPGCDEATPLVRRINQIEPNSAGNFIIQVADRDGSLGGCLRTQIPLFVTEDGTARTGFIQSDELTDVQAAAAIQLFDNCLPCCDCDYYVRTYKGLSRVWLLWGQTAAGAEEVRDVYAANVARWNAQMACRIANPLKLVALSEASCKIFLGGVFCNVSKCCLRDVELRYTMQRYTDGVLDAGPVTPVTMVEARIDGSTTRGEEQYAPEFYSAALKWPVVSTRFDYANPQQTSMSRLRLCVPCGTGQTLKVTLTAHAADPAPAAITEEDCTLPTATVPDDIQAIWDEHGVPSSPARSILTQTIPLNNAANSYLCDCLAESEIE